MCAKKWKAERRKQKADGRKRSLVIPAQAGIHCSFHGGSYMRKLIVSTLALLFVAPALVRAADADDSVQGQFYSFIAPILSNIQYGHLSS